MHIINPYQQDSMGLINPSGGGSPRLGFRTASSQYFFVQQRTYTGAFFIEFEVLQPEVNGAGAQRILTGSVGTASYIYDTGHATNSNDVLFGTNTTNAIWTDVFPTNSMRTQAL